MLTKPDGTSVEVGVSVRIQCNAHGTALILLFALRQVTASEESVTRDGRTKWVVTFTQASKRPIPNQM